MKKSDVQVGGVYTAKVSNKVVKVRLDRENPRGGWDATNLATNKQVRIKSAQRLRAPADGGKRAEPAEPEKTYDPDRCATPRCKGAPTVTHLGRPLCQKCWDRVCEMEDAGAAAARDLASGAATDTQAGEAKPRTRAKRDCDKPKRVSALDAAAEVLRKSGQPMRAQELITAMAEQGLWSSPAGKTPHATLYAAILREIGTKGDAARFRKVDRGQFEYAG